MTEEDFINAATDKVLVLRYLEYVRKERSISGYSEKHHVIPRCFWPKGDKTLDVPSNIVNLSFRQHIEVHLLLFEAFGGRKRYQMLKALRMMCYGPGAKTQSVEDIREKVKLLEEKSLPWDNLPIAKQLSDKTWLEQQLKMHTAKQICKTYSVPGNWFQYACKNLDVKILLRSERFALERNERIANITHEQLSDLLKQNLIDADVIKILGINSLDLIYLKRKFNLKSINTQLKVGRRIFKSADVAWNDAEKIGQRFRNGEKFEKLKSEYSIGSSCLRRILKSTNSYKLVRKPMDKRRKHLRKHCSLLVKAHDNGFSIKEIADRLNEEYLAIWKIINERK